MLIRHRDMEKRNVYVVTLLDMIAAGAKHGTCFCRKGTDL